MNDLTKAQRKLLSRVPMSQEGKYLALRTILLAQTPLTIAELRARVQDQGSMLSGPAMLKRVRELEREHLVSTIGAAGKARYRLSAEAQSALESGAPVKGDGLERRPTP